MAQVVGDRIKQTTATTGTGVVTLGAAPDGFRAFSAVGASGDTCYYVIAEQGPNPAVWELGLGTIGVGGTTLARTNVVVSSAGVGALATLPAGTKDVFLTNAATAGILLAGNAFTSTGAGQDITIKAGAGGGTSGAGGNVTINAGTVSNGAGGDVTITGANGVGTNQPGGDVSIVAGANTGSGTGGNVILSYAGGTEGGRLDRLGNLVWRTAALATSATNGFVYLSGMPGTPTGTPTSYTGRAPVAVDTTNSLMYVYANSRWWEAGDNVSTDIINHTALGGI